MRPDCSSELRTLLDSRIALLDGAMGTTIREYGLDEAAARGDRFADAPKDLLNNGDILSLTQPDTIGDIHRRFFEAGSDIIETNTFSATSISQSEFFVQDPRESGGRKDPEFFQSIIGNPFLRDLARELNFESAKLARTCADRTSEETGVKRYVAGAIGPLTVSLTHAPEHDDPEFRVITFDQVKQAYREQVQALVDGGCDILMVETIFDSLNAKAALVAILELRDEQGVELPLIISAAVGKGGETMISGQRVSALWTAIRHTNPFAVGLNCSLGPEEMRPFIEELSRISDTYISCYPNAGMPDPLSPTGFPYGPEDMQRFFKDFAEAGFINLAGGCCGNTPAHIAAIGEAVRQHPPRARALLAA